MSYIVEKQVTCNTCSNDNCKHGNYYILRDSKGNYLETFGKDNSIKQSNINKHILNNRMDVVEVDKINEDHIMFDTKPVDEIDYDKYDRNDTDSIFKMITENINTKLYSFYNYDLSDSFNLKTAFDLDEYVNPISYDEEDDLKDIYSKFRDSLKYNYNIFMDNVEKISDEYNIIEDRVRDILREFGSVDDLREAKIDEIKDKTDLSKKDLRNLGYRKDMIVYNSEKYYNKFRNIPFVDAYTAHNMSDKYHTVRGLKDVRVKDLKDVDGMNEKKAKKVIEYAKKVDSSKRIDKKYNIDERKECVENIYSDVDDSNIVDEVVSRSKDSVEDDDQLKAPGYDKPRPGALIWDDDSVRIEYIDDLYSDDVVVSTMSHELGHSLQKNRGVPDIVNFINNDMSEKALKELKFNHHVIHNDERHSEKEMFANMIASLSTQPEKTREVAPNACEEFEKLSEDLDGKRGKILKNIINQEYYKS